MKWQKVGKVKTQFGEYILWEDDGVFNITKIYGPSSEGGYNDLGEMLKTKFGTLPRIIEIGMED